MNEEEFYQLIDKSIKTIPSELLEKIENVAIVVEEWPSAHQLEKIFKRGERGMLLGLYEGIPKTRRGNYGIGPTLPDKITIFKKPLEMFSKDQADLEKNVRDTVVHEIAHHFGMDEDDIRNAKSRLKDKKAVC
jgi:predicted Zn-dependent protease with MMP-like domain